MNNNLDKNPSTLKRWILAALIIASSSIAWGFTTPPGPVQNVRTMPIFRYSVNVIWDPPANATEVKAYYLNWQATDGTGLGSKMVPPSTNGAPHVAQLQVFDPAKVYTVNIYPVDAGGRKAAPVTLTNVRSQGTYEQELENSTANGAGGFLFLPENDLPMMRTDSIKLSNDVAGGIQFGGNPNANLFQFASVANNRQEHWHQTGRQTAEGTMTTRVKGKLYLGDNGTRSIYFDNDAGPLGARAWYVILTPVKLDRLHLIPRGGEGGDDFITAWPREQIRVKIVNEDARVSRYKNGTKVSQVPFDWRRSVYFNARQRLRMDVNRNGVTFLADVAYNGTPEVLGTFGTDISDWENIYVYFAMGMYTPNENSRGGYNSLGTPTRQDALALFHWGNVAFTAPAGHAPAVELSYYKDPDMATRMRTRFNPATAFTIHMDAETPDVIERTLTFTDATHYPDCDEPGQNVLNALSNPGTQVLVNGVALAQKTMDQLLAQAPAYTYTIPAGVLRAGANTVQIQSAGGAISIYSPHIDVMVPHGSSMIAAHTPPPISDVLDMMPDDTLLRGWALPSVDFYPPQMASGTITIPYKADSAHTLVTSGVQVGMDSFTVTVNDILVWSQYINPEGIGTPYTEGTMQLDTTQQPDGYYKVAFRARTLAGAVGEGNGSPPNDMEAEYDFDRTMLFYNGPPVNTAPVISNVVFHELSQGTTVATTPLAPGATALVRTDRRFRMNFDVTTEGFVQDMALYYQDLAGVWHLATMHKAGSLEDTHGHFNSGLAARTDLPNNTHRLTYTWDYSVDAAHQEPFVFTDPDGPGIHYKLVALNVGQLIHEHAFTLKLRDPTMAYFTQVNIPPQIMINQPLNATLQVRNIGTTTWQPDGNMVLGQFDEEFPQLFGATGLALPNAVAPGQTVTLQTNYTPTAPAPEMTFHPIMRTRTPDFEIFAATETDTAIITGNNAQFVSQTVTNTMDPNQPYPVTITMRNTGVTTWTRAGGYYLVGQNPAHNVLWSVPQVPLGENESIAPGQTKTFTFDVYSPGFPNIYNFRWQMDQMTPNFGELFGEMTQNVQITVGNPGPILPSFITQPTDQHIQPGQTATFGATVVGQPGPGYQWRVRAATSTANPNPPFVDIPGATGLSYTTPVAALTDHGMQYVLIATNTAGSVESFHATLHVSTGAPSVILDQLATYTATITNAVTAAGHNFLPNTLRLNVVKSEGVAAQDLRLLIGKGSNFMPLTQSAMLDPTQSTTPSIDMTTVTNIDHQDLLNFAVYAVMGDGTTLRTLINPVYTVLLNPPAPPNLGFLPATAANSARINANPLFVDQTIGSVDFTFTRQALSGTLGPTGASAAPAIANQSVAASAQVLNLGQMLLSQGPYAIRATATDWVGNISAPAQAVIFIVGDDLNNIVVYPNPWDTRKHPNRIVRFANLTPQAEIKIFTVSGHWVKTLDASNGFAEWDLTNDAGQNVASGIYIYLATNSSGQKGRGQIHVIR
jgi:hypothetical protein